MSFELFDSHVHLDAKDYELDLQTVLERAKIAGVTRFLSVGASDGFDSAARAIELSKKYAYIWASVGIHPHDAGTALDTQRLKDLAQHERVVAIGETGLDYHYDFAPKKSQIAWFEAQIALAIELQKPLIIHCRLAAEDCLEILIANSAYKVGGVFHCYSENADFAAKLREINFMVSFPGILTFKKSEEMRKTAAAIPLDQIMLETDGPYLAPEPYRGKRCESAFMLKTAEVLAKIKGISIQELASTTTSNAINFYKLTA